MASQPWKHQASESGESAFEDGSRLDLEILTLPSVKQHFLLKLSVTFGFIQAQTPKAKGEGMDLQIPKWRLYI